MSNIIAYRPSMLSTGVFDSFFSDFFADFPRHLQQSTSGYPVADIYTDENGSTVLEKAGNGTTRFSKKVCKKIKRITTLSMKTFQQGKSQGAKPWLEVLPYMIA